MMNLAVLALAQVALLYLDQAHVHQGLLSHLSLHRTVCPRSKNERVAAACQC